MTTTDRPGESLHKADPTAKPKNLVLVLLVISAAQLMVVLDATIVNIALPSIQRDLELTPASLQWVITAYTLAFGSLLLLGGRAGDILGRKKVFIFGIALFSLGSLLGGLAWNEPTLLFGRVVQGLGAAVAAPTALSLIATEFPEGRERNRALAVYAAMSGAGAAIGLIMGGVLTDLLNWRWVLFVNVPIGLLILFAAPRVLHETQRNSGLFDLPGAVTATAGLSALVWGLTNAATDSWSAPLTIALLVAAAALLALFVFLEMRNEHALMPVRIFRNRNRSGAYMIMLIIGAAMFAMFFFLTLFVQEILGYSPLRSGFAFLPVSVAIGGAAALASTAITKVGARPLVLTGTGLVALGMLWLAQINVDSTYLTGLLLPMIVLSIGLGFTFMPLTLAAVSNVADRDAGLASGVLNTTQQIGGAVGLATLSTIFVNALTSRADELGAQAAQAAGGQPSQAALAEVARQAQVHGYSIALYTAAGMAALAFLVSAVTIKVRAEDVADATPVHVG